MPGEPRVLIADDHVEMARVLGDQLGDEGFAVHVVDGGEAAVDALRSDPFDLVICDLRMSDVDGFDVLDAARALDAELPVIIMTAFGAIDTAIEAMKRGAFHYLTKPVRLDEVRVFAQRALEERRLRLENRSLRRVAGDRAAFGAMVGRSAAMQALWSLCERVAASTAPVLIRGESGTGKELVARAIHFEGPRRQQPFVPVNCTAIPDQLLESELFGHARGSFTGATAPRRGLFVEADGGTLFLDEIGDMPVELQSKILRVVEDGEIRPVGADASRRVEVRLIAATNQDLEAQVKAGRFRSDLFYRLDVVPVHIPPLRERAEDIPMLVEHFLRRARERNPQARVKSFAPELVGAMAGAPWPGNVRELQNVIERLVVVGADEMVGVTDLRAIAPGALGTPEGAPPSWQRLIPLRQLEAEYIQFVIDHCDGNKTRAAEILGIDVSTIHRRTRGA